jgi:hypothetical protein
MPLPFLPGGIPLLLGSLPYRSTPQALAAVRHVSAGLLVWPQLPQRSYREGGLAQAAVGFPGVHIDAARRVVRFDRELADNGLDRLGLAYLRHDRMSVALADEDASGLAELSRQREHLRGVQAIKGQLLGPISLSLQLTDQQQRPLIYDTALFEALTHHLHLRAAWQSAMLANLCGVTITCIDEPFLDAVGMPFLPIDWPTARQHLGLVLDGIDGFRGLYAGGAVDWAEVFQLPLDLVIADLDRYAASMLTDGVAWAAFLHDGGVIGLGIVPTEADPLQMARVEALAARVEAFLGGLAAFGIEPAQCLRQAVVTTNDMLGHLSIELAERAMQLLIDLSRILRERYALSS